MSFESRRFKITISEYASPQPTFNWYSEARVAAAKTMQVPVQRIQLWTHKPFSGLQYNTHIDYTADSSVDIGQMSRVIHIVLLIHRDEQFERVATVLEDFKRVSGICVNLGKSAGLWCGAWCNRGDSPLGASSSTTFIRVLGMDIAPRSSVAHREQHLLALLESACRKWTPFTRGLSLVVRARAGNSLVSSTIQHHLHGYLPGAATTAKLQARLARFVWGPDHTAWLPAAVMARPVAIGGLGLLDVGTQLQLACLKGVQVALRGGRNGFNWLVASEAWIRPPPDGTRLQPLRHRLLRLWEDASKILGLNHRLVSTSQLLDLPIVGGCRFLRPPDLLVPARWVGARVRDLGDPHIARPTRSALADAAALAAFCQRVVVENVQDESFPETTLAGAVVLRGTATPFLGLTTRLARRALDRPRLVSTPISRYLARWAATISPPARVDWAPLRRCAFSGHEADAALKLALHALSHPAHPASAGSSCPACGSVDCSLGHRYWSCQSIRPLVREAFNIIGWPPDLQAWIFGKVTDLPPLCSGSTDLYGQWFYRLVVLPMCQVSHHIEQDHETAELGLWTIPD
ncbi:hypothetical protein LAZ67_19000766 [Cordylochernes scorpioides]|uniref:Reverse transcriptase n=1 Tax=Cordylochernes scorpioides TaxID=51811 RepID=A0ABY6LHB7_9ARAC|nr:hypothetical protein LAZ67_19000766 [Cordylochernes scorpioides]